MKHNTINGDKTSGKKIIADGTITPPKSLRELA
jgi:hypothetical protein